MSHEDSPNAPAPHDRRGAVREKAQQVKAKHARARTARLIALIVVLLVVVAAIVVGVLMAIGSQAAKPTAAPRNVDADGGVAITSVAGLSDATPGATTEPTATAQPTPAPTSDATVDIRIYVDYLAAGAKTFDETNAEQLAKWFTAGSARITYYPVAMLTAKSNGTKYSLRAAGAAACVASNSPDDFFAFSHQLLAQQPGIDSAGLDDGQLAALAAQSGVQSAAAVSSCIRDADYVSWVHTATDAALAGIPGTDGLTLTGTPLVLVNGEPYQGALDDPKEFAQFVLTTASDSYYSTPTPTPSS